MRHGDAGDRSILVEAVDGVAVGEGLRRGPFIGRVGEAARGDLAGGIVAELPELVVGRAAGRPPRSVLGEVIPNSTFGSGTRKACLTSFV
jgi:hypothetical protein